MTYRETATKIVGAGRGRIQKEPFWSDLPQNQRHAARLILSRERDPTKYCIDAFINNRPNDLGSPPPELLEEILLVLRSEAVVDAVTVSSAMNGGTKIKVLK